MNLHYSTGHGVIDYVVFLFQKTTRSCAPSFDADMVREIHFCDIYGIHLIWYKLVRMHLINLCARYCSSSPYAEGA